MSTHKVGAPVCTILQRYIRVVTSQTEPEVTMTFLATVVVRVSENNSTEDNRQDKKK